MCIYLRGVDWVGRRDEPALSWVREWGERMPVMENESVVFELGPLTQLVVNRPEDHNTVTYDVLRALQLAFERIKNSPEVRVVALWGAGEEAFISGLDLRGIRGMGPGALSSFVDLGQRVVRLIETVPVPVIAAVNGSAKGAGLEIAMACDLILAGHEAVFGMRDAQLGLLPAFGGLSRLVSRCGEALARRIIYTGADIDVGEALRCGLVDYRAEPGQLSQLVQSVADQIMAGGPLALESAKRLLRTSGEAAALGRVRLENESFLLLFETADAEEGLEAAIQGRKPVFKRR